MVMISGDAEVLVREAIEQGDRSYALRLLGEFRESLSKNRHKRLLDLVNTALPASAGA